MKLTVIAGARPNFMKIAPLMRALQQSDIPCELVHTGQHYDERMSETFFRELAIPKPDVNLGVGSGSHVWQLTEVMRRLGEHFSRSRPDMVLVVGDVNSTLAAALTATKLGIRVGHVEAGLRSFDRSMPEEINRVITDSISEWLFTSEPAGVVNLHREGIADEKIHPVGNIMIDTLLQRLDSAAALQAYEPLGLRAGEYCVVTLHRPANVDDRDKLESILRAVHSISQTLPVVFPIHPRTRCKLQEFGFQSFADLNGVLAIEPQGYLTMLSLMASCRLVMTDSGGIQEETTALQIPCLTLRENTERPVTVELGSNVLVGWKTDRILSAAREALQGPTHRGRVPPDWDGHTS